MLTKKTHKAIQQTLSAILTSDLPRVWLSLSLTLERQSTNQLASFQVLLLETTYHKLLNILMNATVTNVSAKETLTFLIPCYSLHAREPNEFI